MALSALELTTINSGCQAARKIISELEPILHQLNVIYDSEGGVKSTVTQQNMDATSQLSGLTKTQLDDGMFALTSTLKTAIANTYTQLTNIAARGS